MQLVKDLLAKKYGKRILCAIILSVVLAGGFGIFKMLFSNKTIDVFSDCKVVYEGISTKGSAKLDDCSISFDLTKGDLYSFVSNIRYDIKNNGSLKNGDMLSVTADYDKERAKSLNVKLKEDTFEVKIEGLIENYETYADIPADMKTEIDKAMLDAFNKSVLDEHFIKIEKDLKRTGSETIHKMYVHEKNMEDETAGYDIVYLCKASATGQRKPNMYKDEYVTMEENIYYTVIVNHVNSKYTLEEYPVRVNKVKNIFTEVTDQKIIDGLITCMKIIR